MNGYDTNKITIDDIKNASLILECEDKFISLKLGNIKQITREDIDWGVDSDYTNFKIKCPKYSWVLTVLQKNIDIDDNWDGIDFENTDELEIFLSQFKRRELNA